MNYLIQRDNSELMHHGIKGQKWGVRRYQNEDGSLTAYGKERYATSKYGSLDQSKMTDQQIKNNVKKFVDSSVVNDWSQLQSVQQQGANIASTASRLTSKSIERERDKASRNINVSGMDDKELQSTINRMNMERNYKNLITSDIAYGKQQLADTLSVAGDVLAIGASAAAIALAIYQIKNGKIEGSKK